MNRICKWCNETFNNLTGRNFSNHVRWCSKNPNRNNYNKKSYQYKVNTKLGIKQEFIKICKGCGTSFTVYCREKHINNSKYTASYCTRACANKRVHSDLTKQKIHDGIIKFRIDNKASIFPYYKYCVLCNKPFLVTIKTYRQIYCSDVCRSNKRREHLTELNKYRNDCKFNFSLNSFPNEFDFSLITQYGWYKAKNRGNNLNGVSRDHMIPIMYGWKHKIPSEIIAHPANCQLLRHNDNISKYITPSISLEELISRIELWNEKYK